MKIQSLIVKTGTSQVSCLRKRSAPPLTYNITVFLVGFLASPFAKIDFVIFCHLDLILSLIMSSNVQAFSEF